jgi:murein tripeptide amidase MpaA
MAYLNVEEIEAGLTALADTYPSSSQLIALPHATPEGRQSHALRIGTCAAADTPTAVIVGGMHAREWVPPDALVYLAADLLEAHANGTGLRYGGQSFTADQIRGLVEVLAVVLFPCVNPDGRHYSQTVEPMWRKNRRTVQPGLPPHCVGVDLNRNFDALWDFRRHFAPDSGVSASASPCHQQVYVGPAAASEPETQNVIWLLDQHPAARWFVDVHSYVPAIYHTWGFDENQTSDPSMSFQNAAFDGARGRAGDNYREFIPGGDLEELQELGTVMRQAIGNVGGATYELGQSFALYPTSGTSDDLAYARHFVDGARGRILSYTIECGRSFQPTWQDAEDVIREVDAGLTAFCLAAHERAAAPVGPVA